MNAPAGVIRTMASWTVAPTIAACPVAQSDAVIQRRHQANHEAVGCRYAWREPKQPHTIDWEVGDRDGEVTVGGLANASQALVTRQSAMRSPTRANCRRLNWHMRSLATERLGDVHQDTRDE